MEIFLSVSILYKIPGSSLGKQWMQSTFVMPTVVCCAQITNVDGGVCRSATRTSTFTHIKMVQ